MDSCKHKNILIVCGEVSGDFHGGHLLKYLKNINSQLKVFAIGGEHLKNNGAIIIKDITQKATIGFLEPIKHIPSLLILKNKIIKILINEKIDLLICIDYQGFNLLLAKEAKKLDIPVVYYIPPQEWLMESETTIQNIANLTDKIVTIFKPEFEVYKKYSKNTRFFGHPLIQIIDDYQIQLEKKKEHIAIFPGSRKQEIKYCFPEMLKLIQNLQKKNKDEKFIINLPNNQHKATILKKINNINNVEITIGKSYQVLAKSKFAIVTSGTITLECVILGVPHAAIYKLSPLSYFLLNNYLKSRYKYKHYSLPNILANKEIVPEYIQNFDTETIANKIESILANKNTIDQIQNTFQEITNSLRPSDKNIIYEASKYILS